MSRVGLRHIMARGSEAPALVEELAAALGASIVIEDADGRLIHGGPPAPDAAGRFPVTHENAPLGWVAGPAHVRPVATLLEHLARREAERKALGAEVLHLYRELNLIYGFSEKLAALLDVERVAALTLQEARHLIVATDAVVLLLDEESGALAPVASFGEAFLALGPFERGGGLVGAVAASGVGEIVNDVAADRRWRADATPIRALIGAPMKVGERVLGEIVLGSTAPGTYTAAELKLLTTLALQTATAVENARLFQTAIEAARERERLMALHQAAELARAKLDGEMKLAARIQADLFPATLPSPARYHLAARNVPARRCGGDYYDALPLGAGGPDERLLLCVADVSGKGLPASLLMSNMQATLRALLGRAESLPQLAAVASDLLYAATSPEKYVTAALAEVTLATGELRFVGAGHVDNLVLRRDGEMLALGSTGAPLGLWPGAAYEDARGALEPGDALVLYSDGITDAQNAEGEEFGEARLRAVLGPAAGQPAPVIVDRAFEAIAAFVADTPQFDDMTMLVVGREDGT